MARDAQILVVGAGPAGAALAHVLASRGTEVMLLERQLDFEREFRGEVLMPSGLDALEQIGVAEGLKGVPQTHFGGAELFSNGRSFLRVSVDEGFRAVFPVAMSQPALLEMLVADAARSPGFTLVRGATVRELLREDGRVVGVRARTPDGEREFRAQYLVGADGRASVVRREAGLHRASDEPVMDIVWCKMPRPAGFDGVRAYLGRGHLLIGYRCWDDLLQVAWAIEKGSYGDLKARGFDAWIERMAEHVSPDWREHFRTHKTDFTRPFLLDVQADRVDPWSAPGVLLLGDAAHAMSPVGGQGLNVALRDAIVAANHLLPAVESGGAPEAFDAAVRRIERERVAEIAPIQRIQAIPPRFVLGSTWWAAAVRRLIPLVGRLPFSPTPERVPKLASNFFNGVTDVKLRV